MIDREYFFKPYRERITQMQQPHDSLQSSSDYPPPMKNFFNYSPSYFDISRPWTQSSYNKRPVRQEHYHPSNKALKEHNYPLAPKSSKPNRQMHQQVWDHLYHEGLRSQKQIQVAHKEKQFQIDAQCTFQPMIRKSSRYRIPISSNFLERNNIWHENKLQKIVKQKQEQVTKGLQQCTFKPKLNKYHKPISTNYHHLRPSKSMVKLSPKKKQQLSKPKQKQNDFQRSRVQNESISFHRQQVGKIKNLIRNELKRIEL